MNHHSKYQGLQRHSVGPLYPYSVVVLSGKDNGGCCQARNLVTGWQGERIAFSDWQLGFDLAHTIAECEALDRQRIDNATDRTRAFWRSVIDRTPEYVKSAIVVAAVAASSIASAKLAEQAADKPKPQALVVDWP